MTSADAGAGRSSDDREEQDLRERVEQHGWLVMDIRSRLSPGDADADADADAEGDGGPDFQFTVGLTQRGLPEIIVYGAPGEVGGALLNHVAELLVAGMSFSDGQQIEGVLDGGYRLQLWDATWLQDPLGAAFRLYGVERVRVRQLVLPDRRNRLPWEDDYATPHLQPLLFAGPNGVGPREAAGADATTETVEQSCFVCLHVFEGSRPVLYVTRSDGDWCFVCGDGHPEASAFRVVGREHVLERDATLREVLDLRPEEEAERAAPGGAWLRSAIS